MIPQTATIAKTTTGQTTTARRPQAPTTARPVKPAKVAKPLPLLPDPNEFARRAQEAGLTAAVDAARHGNLAPLFIFVQNEQAKRQARATENWAKYRLWKPANTPYAQGIVTPPKIDSTGRLVSLLYRVAVTEDGVKRFLYRVDEATKQITGCLDQPFCDDVNDACRRFGLRLRLETKHAAIMRLKERDAWANGANWQWASTYSVPILDAVTGEVISGGGE